jgi:hypothetical protein
MRGSTQFKLFWCLLPLFVFQLCCVLRFVLYLVFVFVFFFVSNFFPYVFFPQPFYLKRQHAQNQLKNGGSLVETEDEHEPLTKTDSHGMFVCWYFYFFQFFFCFLAVMFVVCFPLCLSAHLFVFTLFFFVFQI